jgi:hypothetical protein
MIQRFEDEYPECRVTPPVSIPNSSSGAKEDDAASSLSSAPNSLTTPFSTSVNAESMTNSTTLRGSDSGSDDGETDSPNRVRLSRHNSDVSLAARALSIEEGHVHRMGQKVKREVLSPQNGAVGVDGDPLLEPEHLQVLRAKLDALKAEELRDSVITEGWEKTAEHVVDKRNLLRGLERDNPEEFKRLKEKLAMEQGVANFVRD